MVPIGQWSWVGGLSGVGAIPYRPRARERTHRPTTQSQLPSLNPIFMLIRTIRRGYTCRISYGKNVAEDKLKNFPNLTAALTLICWWIFTGE